MATYEFFTSCLKTTQDKYRELLNKPRARAGKLKDELKDIVDNIQTALKYDEINAEQARYLLGEFRKINFDNLARDRAANKEKEKYNVGHRFNY